MTTNNNSIGKALYAPFPIHSHQSPPPLVKKIEFIQFFEKLSIMMKENEQRIRCFPTHYSDFAERLHLIPESSCAALSKTKHVYYSLIFHQSSNPAVRSILEVIANGLDAMHEANCTATSKLNIRIDNDILHIEDCGSGIDISQLPYLCLPGYSSNKYAIFDSSKGTEKITGQFGQGALSLFYHLLSHLKMWNQTVPKIIYKDYTLSLELCCLYNEERHRIIFRYDIETNSFSTQSQKMITPLNERKISYCSRKDKAEGLELSFEEKNGQVFTSLEKIEKPVRGTLLTVKSPLIRQSGPEISKAIKHHLKCVSTFDIYLNDHKINSLDNLLKVKFTGGMIYYTPLNTSNRQGVTSICLKGKLLSDFSSKGFSVPQELWIDFDQLPITSDRSSICDQDPSTKDKLIHVFEIIRKHSQLNSKAKSGLLNGLFPLIEKFDLITSTKKILTEAAQTEKNVFYLPDHPELCFTKEAYHLNSAYLESILWNIFYEKNEYSFYSIPNMRVSVLPPMKIQKKICLFINPSKFNAAHVKDLYFNLLLMKEEFNEIGAGLHLPVESMFYHVARLYERIVRQPDAAPQGKFASGYLTFDDQEDDGDEFVTDSSRSEFLQCYFEDEDSVSEGDESSDEEIETTPIAYRVAESLSKNYLMNNIPYGLPKKFIRYFIKLAEENIDVRLIFETTAQTNVCFKYLTRQYQETYHLDDLCELLSDFETFTVYIKDKSLLATSCIDFMSSGSSCLGNVSQKLKYFDQLVEFVKDQGIEDLKLVDQCIKNGNLKSKLIFLLQEVNTTDFQNSPPFSTYKKILEKSNSIDNKIFLLQNFNALRDITELQAIENHFFDRLVEILKFQRQIFGNALLIEYDQKDYQALRELMLESQKSDNEQTRFFCLAHAYIPIKRSLVDSGININPENYLKGIVVYFKNHSSSIDTGKFLSSITKTTLFLIQFFKCIGGYLTIETWFKGYIDKYGLVPEQLINLQKSLNTKDTWSTNDKLVFINDCLNIWESKGVLDQFSRPFVYLALFGEVGHSMFLDHHFETPNLTNVAPILLENDLDYQQAFSSIQQAKNRIQAASFQSFDEGLWSAEIVKNSLEASATQVSFDINYDSTKNSVVVVVKDDGLGMDEEGLKSLKIPGHTTKTQADENNPNFGQGFFSLLSLFDEIFVETSVGDGQCRRLQFIKSNGEITIKSERTVAETHRGTTLTLSKKSDEPLHAYVKLRHQIISHCQEMEKIQIVFQKNNLNLTSEKTAYVSHAEPYLINKTLQGYVRAEMGMKETGIYRKGIRISDLPTFIDQLIPNHLLDLLKDVPENLSLFLPETTDQIMNRSQIIEQDELVLAMKQAIIKVTVFYLQRKIYTGDPFKLLSKDFWDNFQAEFDHGIATETFEFFEINPPKKSDDYIPKFLTQMNDFFHKYDTSKLIFEYDNKKINLEELTSLINKQEEKDSETLSCAEMTAEIAQPHVLMAILISLKGPFHTISLFEFRNEYRKQLVLEKWIDEDGEYLHAELLNRTRLDGKESLDRCCNQVQTWLRSKNEDVKKHEYFFSKFNESILSRLDSLKNKNNWDQNEEKLNLTLYQPFIDFIQKCSTQLFRRNVDFSFYSEIDGVCASADIGDNKINWNLKNKTITHFLQCLKKQTTPPCKDPDESHYKIIINLVSILAHELSHLDDHVQHDSAFYGRYQEILSDAYATPGQPNPLTIFEEVVAQDKTKKNSRDDHSSDDDDENNNNNTRSKNIKLTRTGGGD